MRIINKLRKGYSKLIVCQLWVHWFNPLYTLYFNFIFFPLRQAIKFPVFVYGWPKLFSQYGTMECVGNCKTGMVRLNVTIPGGPQFAAGNTQLNIWGKVIFRGKCEIGTGNKLNVGYSAILTSKLSMIDWCYKFYFDIFHVLCISVFSALCFV